jgi:hypothetical protein
MRQVSSIWVQDGSDYILHLGTMKKAMVVAYYPSFRKHYSISPRSYFPLTDAQMEKRFEHAYEATECAIEIIKEWLNSIVLDGKMIDGKVEEQDRLVSTSHPVLKH